MDEKIEKVGRWIYSNMGCVINCSNCGERLELCYPDGTDIRETAYCPFCGAKMENKIETTQKAIRKNAGEENAFVDLLNKETKELSDSFDSYLFYHGYRKESDTAREILDELLKEKNLENVYFTDENGDIRNRQVIRIEKIKDLAEKYGVDLGE